MKKPMLAQEARISTKSAIESRINKEVEVVNKIINDGIKAGLYFVTEPISLSNEMKDLLRSLGYTVIEGMHQNEPRTKISWEEPARDNVL